MNTTMKKLVLHRETLAKLDSAQLRKVAGQSFPCPSPSVTCQPPCLYSDGQNTCLTCFDGMHTCTSNNC